MSGFITVLFLLLRKSNEASASCREVHNGNVGEFKTRKVKLQLHSLCLYIFQFGLWGDINVGDTKAFCVLEEPAVKILISFLSVEHNLMIPFNFTCLRTNFFGCQE